jgi:NAD+-dependent farnesol dehydrogenase
VNVLLTGGTGYLGGRVAAALVAAGHDVRLLCRPGRETAIPAGARAVRGDVRDAASVRAALDGCDALVHMAAMVKRWTRDRSEFDRVNVDGSATVLGAAAAAGVARILFTSSIVALGPTAGGVADEERAPDPGEGSTDYERTKRKALEVARREAARGRPIVIVYPGIVYGPGASTEGNLLQPMLADHLRGRLLASLGRGDLRICYAYVDDVARGHVLALEHGVTGRGYILGGVNATQDELFRALSAITGRPAPRIAVPYGVASFVAAMLVLRARLTGRLPELTPGVVTTFRHEWAYSSERAVREIGYAVTPLGEGLRRTLEALDPHAAPAAASAAADRPRGNART